MTAATVRASLSSVPATERKMGLTAGGGGTTAAATDSNEFLLVQVAALNALLSKTLCNQCFQPGIAVAPETRLGLAVKMALRCSACGASETQWSSPREGGSRAFELNLRSVQAIKSIGKGATALTDSTEINLTPANTRPVVSSLINMTRNFEHLFLKTFFLPPTSTCKANISTTAMNIFTPFVLLHSLHITAHNDMSCSNFQ